jgi:flagellin
MPMTINTNVVSLNAQRNLTTSQMSLATSMERLSSGLRVNSSKDDAAGLAIANRMNAQIRGINVAIRNANDGISLAQTAEGALATVTDALQRMRELAVQAQNGSNGTSDRANLDTEYQQLSQEITRIAQQTKFNGIAIIGTAGAGAQVFQVGANNGDTLTVTTSAVTTVGGAVTTVAAAATALTALDTALDTITTNRATYGAAMSRFGMAISNLAIAGENQSAARGRIVDADFAAETANLSRAQILQQAGSAMVAQANQLPNLVMSLLR